MSLTWQLQSTCFSNWQPKPTVIGPACCFSFCSQYASCTQPRTYFSDRAEVFAVSVTWMSFFIVAHVTSCIHQEFTQIAPHRDVFPQMREFSELVECLTDLCAALTWMSALFLLSSHRGLLSSLRIELSYSVRVSSTVQASQRFQTDMSHIDGAKSRGAHQLKPSSQDGISVKSRCHKAVTANPRDSEPFGVSDYHTFFHV